MCKRHREQARLPQFFPSYPKHPCPPQIPVGAELARESGLSANDDVECANAIASKLGSHSFSELSKASVPTPNPCGSGLARDSGLSVSDDVECANAIASKLGSHSFFRVVQSIRDHHKSLWELSLLAIADCQSMMMPTDTTPSRASPLPQFFRVVQSIRDHHKSLWERACSRKRRVSQ